MSYDMKLVLIITFLLIVFLILVILIISAPQTDKNKPKTQKEISFSEADISSKINLIARDIEKLEKILKPVMDIIQKHENILSGSQSKGSLGEKFVEEKLADLPHEWYDRKVQLSGGIVEFALKTPNKRWIPIDSQWTATDLLVKLEQSGNQAKKESLRSAAHQAVSIRAKEALKYLDKEKTLGFSIVAVPDSVFNLCVDIQAELASYSIVLVSYSLLVPYILLMVNQYLKTIHSTDVLQSSEILRRATAEIELIQKYIAKEVAPPLEIISMQQSQHFIQKHGLENLKNMNNPVPNSAITSIPATLQHKLNHVREGLLEDIAYHINGQSKDNEIG